MPAQRPDDVRQESALSSPAAGQTWSGRRVVTALLAGVPLIGAFCLLAQWPLWKPGSYALASVNLLVTVAFYVTSVFVAAEPGHRLTGAGLATAAFLWPVNWVNEWHVGPLPLLAYLEGPLASLPAVWALLRYPQPWSRRRREAVVIAILLLTQCLASLQVVTSLPQWHQLPPGTFWLSWWPDRTAYAVSQDIYTYGDVTLAAAAAIALSVRFTRLKGLDRQVMRPVLLAIAVAGALTVASNLAAAAPLSTRAVHEVYVLEGIAVAGVPLAFLVASIRRRLAREWIPKLIRELGTCPTPGRVQYGLRRALADPSLRLLYQVGGDLVDTEGVPQPPLPPNDPAAATATPGRVVLLTANRLHSRYPEVIRAATSVAALALENTSLQASISAQIHEVSQSAHRLTTAVDDEHRRIQAAVGQICDGELTELAAQLDSLGESHDTPGLAALLAAAPAMLSATQRELTRLAQGIDPAELTQLGLAGAITAAARRLSRLIVVSVTDEPLVPEIRAAAYFVLSELMTNAVKHAGNSVIEVTVAVEGHDLVLTVADHGPGGADPNGSGLRGLAERAVSLCGSLTVSSAPDRGTRITVRLPVAVPAPHSFAN